MEIRVFQKDCRTSLKYLYDFMCTCFALWALFIWLIKSGKLCGSRSFSGRESQSQSTWSVTENDCLLTLVSSKTLSCPCSGTKIWSNWKSLGPLCVSIMTVYSSGDLITEKLPCEIEEGTVIFSVCISSHNPWRNSCGLAWIIFFLWTTNSTSNLAV